MHIRLLSATTRLVSCHSTTSERHTWCRHKHTRYN